jgi:hypothetical protein
MASKSVCHYAHSVSLFFFDFTRTVMSIVPLWFISYLANILLLISLSLTMGNAQSVRHDPSPYHSAVATSAPKHIKPAIRRSTSVRSEADGMGPAQDKTRYIPKMNQTENPTRPYIANSVATGGIESPQWGWYINTTPPTPDMYHSHTKSPKQMGQSSAPSQAVGNSKNCHNQVFQNLQNSNRPMGWTSVPI